MARRTLAQIMEERYAQFQQETLRILERDLQPWQREAQLRSLAQRAARYTAEAVASHFGAYASREREAAVAQGRLWEGEE